MSTEEVWDELHLCPALVCTEVGVAACQESFQPAWFSTPRAKLQGAVQGSTDSSPLVSCDSAATTSAVLQTIPPSEFGDPSLLEVSPVISDILKVVTTEPVKFLGPPSQIYLS
jgi:hypothetical protein